MHSASVVATAVESEHELSLIALQVTLDGTTTRKYINSRGTGVQVAAAIHGLKEVGGGNRAENPLTEIRLSLDEDTLGVVQDYLTSGPSEGNTSEPLLRGLKLIIELLVEYGEVSKSGVHRRIKRPPVGVVLQKAAEEDIKNLQGEAQNVMSSRLEEVAHKIEQWELPQEDKEWVETNGATIVYTDGSTICRTGFAAWGWWVNDTTFDAGTVSPYNSDMAEKQAVIMALKSITGPVLVVADQVSYPKVTKTGSALQQQVYAQYRELIGLDRVRLVHTMGHQYCQGNLNVDALAGDAARNGWAKISSCPDLLRAHQLRWEEETLEVEAAKLAGCEAWASKA